MSLNEIVRHRGLSNCLRRVVVDESTKEEYKGKYETDDLKFRKEKYKRKREKTVCFIRKYGMSQRRNVATSQLIVTLKLLIEEFKEN